jgi:hypothetical protein
MGMLRLAPEIQQQILSMPDMALSSVVTERVLRPIAQLAQRVAQVQAFEQLIGQARHRDRHS